MYHEHTPVWNTHTYTGSCYSCFSSPCPPPYAWDPGHVWGSSLSAWVERARTQWKRELPRLCVPASPPITLYLSQWATETQTHTEAEAHLTHTLTQMCTKMSLHTQWVLSDAQSWMCLCRHIYLISWEVMMMGFKNLKGTLRGRGGKCDVILNTQSLGVTIPSPWRIYLSTLHRHKFPNVTVWYCVYKMERESHTTGEQLFTAHTDLVKL